MTRINTKTHCDLSGCEHTIVGPTRGNGWTIWMGKDLCPEHDVSEMPDIMQEMFDDSEWGFERILLYDSPNHMRNVDGNQIVFRKISWCTAHDSNGYGPPNGSCHYSALRQATQVGVDTLKDCYFDEKLIEV